MSRALIALSAVFKVSERVVVRVSPAEATWPIEIVRDIDDEIGGEVVAWFDHNSAEMLIEALKAARHICGEFDSYDKAAKRHVAATAKGRRGRK